MLKSKVSMIVLRYIVTTRFQFRILILTVVMWEKVLIGWDSTRNVSRVNTWVELRGWVMMVDWW